jgi:hypothetical protein
MRAIVLESATDRELASAELLREFTSLVDDRSRV